MKVEGIGNCLVLRAEDELELVARLVELDGKDVAHQLQLVVLDAPPGLEAEVRQLHKPATSVVRDEADIPRNIIFLDKLAPLVPNPLLEQNHLQRPFFCFYKR